MPKEHISLSFLGQKSVSSAWGSLIGLQSNMAKPPLSRLGREGSVCKLIHEALGKKSYLQHPVT